MSFAATHALAHHAGARLARCTAGTSTSTITRLPKLFLAAAATSTDAGTATAGTPATSNFPRPVAAAQRRGFAHSIVRPKKAGGASKKEGKKDKKAEKAEKATSSQSQSQSQTRDAADEDDGAGHPQADAADPFNFADVESRWQRSEVHHEDKFKELRRALGGGAAADGSAAVDLDAIGATPVAVGGEHQHQQQQQQQQQVQKGHHKGASAAAAASAPATTPLAELALVIPRAGGRFVELRMHSAASRKAIVRAVQASPLFRGQQPQPDPDDELVLLIRTGSPHEGASGAGGSSEAAAVAAERARRVSDLANAWRAQIRRATARRQKTHQTWKKDGSVRPDDLHRLDRDLLRGQEKRLARIDAVEKETVRQLERTGRR